MQADDARARAAAASAARCGFMSMSPSCLEGRHRPWKPNAAALPARTRSGNVGPSMDSSPTSDLIRAARGPSGSTRALDCLYERYSPRVLSYIRLKLGRSLRQRLQSRDILQATLLKSFGHLADFRGSDGKSLVAWLARIADREILDRADYHGRERRNGALESPIDDHPDLTARVRSVLSQAIADERAGALEEALESLSEPHRQIILLRKFEDLSFPEIARRLGKSEDACRMLLARAMTALTIRLSATGGA